MNNIINIFKQMHISVWRDKNIAEKERLLQEIVNLYAKQFHFECPKVWTADFKGDDAIARFFHNANVIEVRQDVVENDAIQTNNNEVARNTITSIFYYLTHEIEHAKQCGSDEYQPGSQKEYLLKNNRHELDPQFNFYFSKNSTGGTTMNPFAYYLYALQPVERFAWEFAEKEFNGFVELMHKLFPNDMNYINVEPPVNYKEIVDEAKMMLRTNDPEKDIDNILLTMNGSFVEEPLNECICTIIKETQHESMYQRIKMQQEINKHIIEEKLRESSVEEIEIDEDWFVERK